METLTIELSVGDGRSIEAYYSWVPSYKAKIHLELPADEAFKSDVPVRTIFEEAVWDTGENLTEPELQLYKGQLDRLAQDEALRQGL
jgi:hypothetical protein